MMTDGQNNACCLFYYNSNELCPLYYPVFLESFAWRLDAPTELYYKKQEVIFA